MDQTRYFTQYLYCAGDLVNPFLYNQPNFSVKLHNKWLNYQELLRLSLATMFPKRAFDGLLNTHMKYTQVVMGILQRSILTDDIPSNEIGQYKLLDKQSFRIGTCLPQNKFYATRLPPLTTVIPSLPAAPPNTTLYFHFKNNKNVTVPRALIDGIRRPAVESYHDRNIELDFGSGFYTFTDFGSIYDYIRVYERGSHIKSFMMVLIERYCSSVCCSQQFWA